jgi:cytochrome c553
MTAPKTPLRRKLLKGAGYTLAGLVALVVVALGGVYGFAEWRMSRTYAVPAIDAAYADARPVALASDRELVERGRHVAAIRACNDCHGADLGGNVMADDFAFGRITASNLTAGRGGVGATFTDADWDRAIRHGVRPDGKGLLVMPSYEYHGMSDDDFRALVAYLRTVPPVDREVPADRVGPIGRFLVATNAFPAWSAALIDHAAARPEAPAPGPTAAYGAYLAVTCHGCHGPELTGRALPGVPPGTPESANLTPDDETGLGTWTEGDFVRALREGVRPDGRRLHPLMPIPMTAQYTDVEVAAMWAHLQTLEPVRRPTNCPPLPPRSLPAPAMTAPKTSLPKTLLRGAGYAVGGLLVAALVTFAVVYVTSERRMNATYEVPAVDAAYAGARPVALAADRALIERGAHAAAIRGCVDCHGEDLGGQVVIDDPALGLVTASNLTAGRGGVGARYTDADWDRAVRHGVDPDGRGLLVMPSAEYHAMSDDDFRALVAFLRSRPPVDREVPDDRLGPVGRLLVVTNLAPAFPAELIDHAAPRPEAPAPGPTAAYGAYLVAICRGCHQADLAGGTVPGHPPDEPPSANLTPDPETGLGAWTEADFVRALREGVRPDGRRLNVGMPVAMTAQFTDVEVAALWAYLQTLDPVRKPGH